MDDLGEPLRLRILHLQSTTGFVRTSRVVGHRPIMLAHNKAMLLDAVLVMDGNERVNLGVESHHVRLLNLA